MNLAIVTYENGAVIPTSINGTIPEIQRYFSIGSWFNIGSGENDLIAQVKSLTVVTELNRNKFTDFEKWIYDGNVEQIGNDTYIEQTTQWKKKFTRAELIDFYKREYEN